MFVCRYCNHPVLYHDLSPEVKGVRQRVPLVGQELKTRPEHLSLYHVFIGFVLLNL
jgi:hypothetical protein